MKPLATLINVIAFTALFFAYASVASAERPDGVRRALQTYSCQAHSAVPLPLKPIWQIENDVGWMIWQRTERRSILIV